MLRFDKKYLFFSHRPKSTIMASTSGTDPLDFTDWDQELISTIFPQLTDECISPICWFPLKGHKISLAYVRLHLRNNLNLNFNYYIYLEKYQNYFFYLHLEFFVGS